MAKRILMAVLVFAAISALALLLPHALPGELAGSSLTRHAGAGCTTCPPAERLAAAGVSATKEGWFVNARFDAQPRPTRIILSFEGVRGTMELQRVGQEWRRLRGPNDAGLPLSGVAERGNLTVFALPLLKAGGVAVATGGGDRLPVAGHARPVYPQPPHFNITDLVLLIILAVTALLGFRRGVLPESGNLAAIFVSFAIAALLYRPLALVIAPWVGNQLLAASLSGGLLVVVSVLISYLLMPRLMRLVTPLMKWVNPAFDGAIGSALACVRQLPMLALLLMIGIDLALLHWAAANIQASLFGSTLLMGAEYVFAAA